MSHQRVDPLQGVVDDALHQLGRNDASIRLTPRLGPSDFFAGMTAVKPESVDRGGTRTGRNERR